MNFHFPKLAMGSAIAFAALFLSACSDNDDNGSGDDNRYPVQITPTENITKYFDPTFAQALKDRGIIPSADEIYGRDVLNVAIINISGNPLNSESHLSSLAGIECFRNLKELDAKSNDLSTLDLSYNTELETVRLSNNRLTSLTLPKRDEGLHILECGKNRLTSLDLSGLDDLERVDASDNLLTSINVTGCTDLTTLYLNNNSLSAINISGSPRLTAFSCEDNPGANGTLSVRVSFDPTMIPQNFTTGTWTYQGSEVAVVYTR